MATASGARLAGDDYQHLFAWQHALELLMPQRKVISVIVEDEKAGSADDVTILREFDAHPPDVYHQIKYHVDQRGNYSEAALTHREGTERSLLQKWFRSWETLTRERPGRPVEIHIVSNWGWATGDEIAPLVGRDCNDLHNDLFTATERQNVGRLRGRLVAHLGTTAERFAGFARTLRFYLGYECWQVMSERVAERMEHYGLKFDAAALLVAVGIVRDWVKTGRQEVTRAALEGMIAKYDLRLPEGAKPGVTVYLSTIKEQRFDVAPDYELDWRHHFLGSPEKRGHEPKAPQDWNGKMLPELLALEARINRETPVRLLRARGLARLPAWFAFGHTFSDVARYTVEVAQGDDIWQSDAKPSEDFSVQGNTPAGEVLAEEGDTLAVGISVSDTLEMAVRRHIPYCGEKVRAALFLRPGRDLGRHCLRSAGDAVALAENAKTMIRAFVRQYGARRVLLYYLGPLSGACFIGHRLNAVCKEIQVMEWTDTTYVPSFLLT